MGGPGVESLAPGGVPPAPQPLTPSGRETLAPIHARVFSCALSNGKWASWRLHKTGSRSTARRTTVPISSNSGRPKAMRLRSQAKAEQLAPSSHPVGFGHENGPTAEAERVSRLPPATKGAPQIV